MWQGQPGRHAHTRMLAFHDMAVAKLRELSQGHLREMGDPIQAGIKTSIDAARWGFEFGLSLCRANPELAELTLREIEQEREGAGPMHRENYQQDLQEMADALRQRAQAIADGER